MADFKELINLIGKSVIDFNNNIPEIQQRMLNDLLILTKKLDVKDGKIRVATANLKLIAEIKAKIEKIILNPQYIESVKTYVSAFDAITKIQNNYFLEVEKAFKPPKLAGEIRKQAVKSVVNNLTETGLNANVIDKVQDYIRQATTSGASYATLNQQLTDFLTETKTGDGQLLKYTKQITTDALNQFSGQYTQIISSDLDFEWFRYSGSNIETTRAFCLACTKRKFFHISELPNVLKGDFAEFREFDGSMNKKTDLPEGMIPGTDVSNFMTYRGGYNCGHQLRPCNEQLVPETERQRVFALPEYKLWKRLHGKAA